jgi:pilus assembly protein Flp/PilA
MAGQSSEPGEPHLNSFLKRFAADESGATAIEYGLIAGIIGVGVVIGLTSVKDGLVSLFSTVGENL